MVGPTRTQGAPTYGNPQKSPISVAYYQIPAGTNMPDGLGIEADGKDVGGSHGETHHTICPIKRMPAEEFVKKYQTLPWTPKGKKK
ncbi:hypothetical protein [Variovorax boronicumulans]|uniref:Tse2 family ADP-ribosyltransferase toxin n=1 Tax=Variovorax boronicumulans TaxID=436515 RepID=UPI003F5189E6